MYRDTNLNLKDNNLTGTIPIEVTQMMQLTWGGLGLSGNQMSGEIPSEVLSWSKWSSLVLLGIFIRNKRGMDLRIFRSLTICC